MLLDALNDLVRSHELGQFLESLQALNSGQPTPQHANRTGGREWVFGLLASRRGDVPVDGGSDDTLRITDELAEKVLRQPKLQLTLSTTMSGPDVQLLFFHVDGMAVGLMLDIQRASSRTFFVNGLRDGFDFTFGPAGDPRRRRVRAELSRWMPDSKRIIQQLEQPGLPLASQEVEFAQLTAEFGRGACEAWAPMCRFQVSPGKGVFIGVFDQEAIRFLSEPLSVRAA